MLALEHREPLAQGENLHAEIVAGAEEAEKIGKDCGHESGHGCPSPKVRSGHFSLWIARLQARESAFHVPLVIPARSPEGPFLQFAPKAKRRDIKTLRWGTRVARARRDSVGSAGGSGGHFPDVSVMQAADTWQRFQSRGGWRRLDRSAGRRVLVQPEVRAIFVVVGSVFASDAPHMLLIERDHVIETLAAETAHPSFRRAVLPGAPDTRAGRPDAGGLQQIQYLGA